MNNDNLAALTAELSTLEDKLPSSPAEQEALNEEISARWRHIEATVPNTRFGTAWWADRAATTASDDLPDFEAPLRRLAGNIAAAGASEADLDTLHWIRCTALMTTGPEEKSFLSQALRMAQLGALHLAAEQATAR